MRDAVTRREAMEKIARWSPLLSALGFRFHAYSNAAAAGWRGWLTWCNRLVGFVRFDGSIRWWLSTKP
jgi:hypothetical protein